MLSTQDKSVLEMKQESDDGLILAPIGNSMHSSSSAIFESSVHHPAGTDQGLSEWGGGGVTGATIKNSGNIISGIPLAGSVLPPPSKIIKVEYLYYIYVISFMNH